MKTEGFIRVRVNGDIRLLEEDIRLDKNKKHSLELIVDRLVLKEGIRERLSDSIEIALKYGNGLVYLFDGKLDHFFSQQLYCAHCDLSLSELSPRSFSFNSPMGACSEWCRSWHPP